MKQNYIINIGRQLGSGGREIGETLARQLDFSYYDKELIGIASKESGLSKEFFQKADEQTQFNLFSDFLGWFSSSSEGGYLNNYLRNESLFQIQSDVIRQLAEKKSCVFVGRCSDYILRDHQQCLNVFICANLEDRIQRVAEQQRISLEKAKEVSEKIDKRRAEYYNYYTNRIWGMATSYHLCINSSILGIEETASHIRFFAEKKFGI